MVNKRTSQLTRIKPTVENVITVQEYSYTVPVDGGGPDQVVLYGGGRKFSIGPLQDGRIHKDEVELFILDQSIVIWDTYGEYGVMVPYSSVIYHGVGKKMDGSAREGLTSELLLTFETDNVLQETFPGCGGVASTELRLTPMYSTFDRHTNQEIESLFTFDKFGVSRGDEMVAQCHGALARCMELHGAEFSDPDDDDDDMDDDMDVQDGGIASILQQTAHYDYHRNDGLADDL